MLPSSTEVRVPLLLLKRFVTAFGNVRQWLGERAQTTKLASMFFLFFQGVSKYSTCLRQPAVSRCALSPTPVIALEFIIALMLIIAPCAVRCVWKVQQESGTCSYPQPGFPYVNSLCCAELSLSPATSCLVKEPDSDVQTGGITWQHQLKNRSQNTTGL